jgi:hypothetical protein
MTPSTNPIIKIAALESPIDGTDTLVVVAASMYIIALPHNYICGSLYDI